MNYKLLLLMAMLFFHIVDDYYLQGFLASAKQKTWWEKHYPNPIYRYDYLMALVEHAFSWAFMVHIPVIACVFAFDLALPSVKFSTVFISSVFLHAVIDNEKANKLNINLIQDQLLHITQIMFMWCVYAIL